jgi:hypothetical protein
MESPTTVTIPIQLTPIVNKGQALVKPNEQKNVRTVELHKRLQLYH